MKRVLKNDLREHIRQGFRGRDIWFKSKASTVFDMENEEENAKYYFWLERFQPFIRDITSRVSPYSEQPEIIKPKPEITTPPPPKTIPSIIKKAVPKVADLPPKIDY